MLTELTREDLGYPDLLKNIHDPPRRLWVQGDSDLLSREILIAVVGARHCTPYGEKVAYELARDLARSGVTVVSGLALGIDAASHRGALDGGGKTVAVLGCGIDLMTPSQNASLKEKIVGSGAVVTEFAPGTKAAPWTFPRRNRIISGLSRGVVIVEAGLRSGSLITANLALEQGREVFAVPGPITSPLSDGTNRLIQNGAKAVLSVRDILDETGTIAQFASSRPVPREEIPEAGEAGEILRMLVSGPKHMDDLVSSSGIAIERVSGLLVELEIRGKISSLPGGFFERCC